MNTMNRPPVGRTSRRKAILLAITAAVMVAALTVVATTLASRCRDVPLRELLASGAEAPGGDTDTDTWAMTADVNLGVQDGTRDNIQRIWKRVGGANMRESVFRLGNPLSARSSYYFGSPRFNDKYQEVHWADDVYRSPTADRSQLACGEGTAANCSRWVYWAQYGQYLLRVEYLGGGDNLDAARFAEYVASIDRHVSSRLVC